MRALLTLVMVVSAVHMFAAVDNDFSIYKRDIIDKYPFGKPPPVPVVQPGAGAPPPEPPPAMLNDLKLVSLSNDPRTGIRVGIVNVRKKNVYYLSIGQTDNDLTLISADLEAEKVLIKYNNHEKELTMGGAVSPAHQPPPAHSSPVQTLKTDQTGSSKPHTEILSYRDRLKARTKMLEERRKRAEDQPKYTKEELKEHLKEYQLDLIRAKGKLGPPLPIPLTKEMDDKLVREGVLPPQE